MLFRQLFDAESGSYSYLLADSQTGDAALIDSVQAQVERDATLIEELGLNLKYVLETHIHADHVTGTADLKRYFPQAHSVVSIHSGCTCADLAVQDGESLQLGAYAIQVLATPGHTQGCLSYLAEGRVFTGDALLIRGCGRTDFQGGNPGQLYDSITQKLFLLPADTLVYPGHNYIGLTVSRIGEEKQLNPRLAGKTREEFIATMDTLDLPYPKKMAEAVPANLNCGQVGGTSRNGKRER